MSIFLRPHHVNPHDYLRDVLTRLPTMTNQDDMTALLPEHWKSAQTPTHLIVTISNREAADRTLTLNQYRVSAERQKGNVASGFVNADL